MPLHLEVGRLADQRLTDLVGVPLAHPLPRLLGDPLAGRVVVSDVEVGLRVRDDREVFCYGNFRWNALVEDLLKEAL